MTTLNEINLKARQVLRTALDAADYARYQQQFSAGSGDYTAERHTNEERDTDAIAAHVKDLKTAGLLPPPPSAQVFPIG
ncbi:MAG: hypothetical protein IPK32_26590 [Verrucomicrobiaceae bacterium]|nr:hypothetical protein [Verrucomicrobiaceae bacterium]